MMKRKIQIEIDVPEYIDDSFIEMLSMLDSGQLNLIKGTVIGMLLADDKLSNDDIDKKIAPYRFRQGATGLVFKKCFQ